MGRILFNQIIPQDLGFTKRETAEDMLQYEINYRVGKKELKKIIKACYDVHNTSATAEMLDKIKNLGYKYATLAGLSIALFDIEAPKEREAIIEEANNETTNAEKQYKRGLITLQEKQSRLSEIWAGAMSKMSKQVSSNYDSFNPIKMMSESGSRGSAAQINQLSGMRGLMSSTSGKLIEVPVRSSFKQGLSVIEYFISTRGGRKGLVDKALKTADAGYLTRRLVDVAQDVIIRDDDCFATLGEKVKGMEVQTIMDGNQPLEKLSERIAGRFVVNDVIDPTTGELIVPANTMCSKEQAIQIENAGITSVAIRTVLTCKSKVGICAKCYGKNMSTKEVVPYGEAVGIIAAQAIGEPGTQLTMNVFHEGGISAGDDITQGLPRIEELFEARKPKGVAVISTVAGKVKSIDPAKQKIVITSIDNYDVEFSTPYGAKMRVAVGDTVEPGGQLTEGSINPHDILVTKGVKGVQDYLMKEVHKVYKKNGVDVNDKHIEIMLRQMLKRVKIEDSGDTAILPGELLDIADYEELNEKTIAEGLEPATAKRILLSITKASLATNSFLSAASFQETVRVLTDAAIKGKIDPLVGLKENVIIGKYIPAGTGLRRYRELVPSEN